MKLVEEKRDQEMLTPAQRWAGLLIAAGMLLVSGFFAYHQSIHTGFFTNKFGPVEMLALYGPILLSMLPPVVRAWSGRKNPARPFEAAMNLALAVGSLWLWIQFPFNFTHLADILPIMLRLIISWITNDLGKIVLMLQVIIGSITGLVTTTKYLSLRRAAGQS